MPEWLEVVNGWTSLPLQIFGFGIAFIQIAKAISAADAAKTAANAALTQVSSNLLLIVLPQLNQAEANLDWAVDRGDPQVVAHYLGIWRWQAGQARGHLGSDETHASLRTKIQASIALAADAKLAIQDPAADVRQRMNAVQKAIAEVTGEIGEVTASGAIREAA